MSSMLRVIVALLAAAWAAASVNAAAPLDHLPSLAGDYFEMRAREIGRPFHIYVRLPPDYEKSKQALPVVYLTDGDSAFPILAACHLFLHYGRASGRNPLRGNH